jgi:serine/threonine-protein kinase
MSEKGLEKAAPTPTRASAPGGSTSGLPIDLLHEASRRLGWAGLTYAVTFFLATFGSHFFGQAVGLNFEHSIWGQTVQVTVSLISIALGLLVFLFSRYSNLRPELLLNIGLVFEVVGAFGISMAQFWGVFPEWDPAVLECNFGIPWECVWIVFFPFLAPNRPNKILVASLAAASTGLLTAALSRAAGATDPSVPMSVFVVYFGGTTYVCAGLAYFISRTVYRFGKRLTEAREIGSYRLVRPLGEGGMGEVWLGQHRMLARPAAIKLIHPESLAADLTTAQTAIRRFEREARSTAALGSNHTVTIFDFGITEDGAFYYVMELLDGLNLYELVKRFGPVSASRAVYLLRQVCHSLGEAHDRGLIHRDIKPANIHTCRQGPDYDFIKVLDFGLVKSAGQEGGATELTVEGIAGGTPAYMAPEVATGAAYIDARVDIYGLGCVGYWLLTGEHVFVRDTPLATVVAHVKETPVPPSQRTELPIPDALERAILQCLEKDPADRPQTADALSQLLTDSLPDLEWDSARATEWWRLHLADEGPSIELPPNGASQQDIVPVKAE